MFLGTFAHFPLISLELGYDEQQWLRLDINFYGNSDWDSDFILAGLQYHIEYTYVRNTSSATPQNVT